MEVTTEHQKLHEISTNSGERFFCPKGGQKTSDKGQSPLQELEVSPRRRAVHYSIEYFAFFLHPGKVYWDLTLPVFVPSVTNI